jgi:hypothetical protein
MRAAKNFTMGVKDAKGNESRRSFVAGEEIPKKLVSEVSDTLILEKVAKKSPDLLSREQLMELAGINEDTKDVGDGDENEDVDEEFDEAEFREGLSQMTTKRELAEWAVEFYNVELSTSDSREQMENALVEWITSEDEEEDEDEDEDEDE